MLYFPCDLNYKFTMTVIKRQHELGQLNSLLNSKLTLNIHKI